MKKSLSIILPFVLVVSILTGESTVYAVEPISDIAYEEEIDSTNDSDTKEIEYDDTDEDNTKSEDDEPALNAQNNEEDAEENLEEISKENPEMPSTDDLVEDISEDNNSSIIFAETDETSFGENKVFINVQSFGAVGDGVSDDTLAIKNALLASDGNVLYFPEGTYLITDISCTINYLEMRGDANTLIKKSDAVIEPMFTFFDCDSAIIQGISFDAGREDFGDDYDTACVYFRGNVSNVSITECTFRNCSREATAFLGSAENVYIANNYYENTSALVWLKGRYLDGLVFENNEAHNGRINGVELIASDINNFTKAIIRNNKFYNFGGNIVQCKNVADVDIHDNYVEGAKNVIYFIKGDDSFVMQSCVISNNKGSADELIHIDGIGSDEIKYESVELSNNTFELVKGLKVENVSSCILNGENYVITPEGKINIYKTNSFLCKDAVIKGETASREFICFKSVNSISMDNVDLAPGRPVYVLSNIGSKGIILKSVYGNFINVNKLYITNDDLYEYVEDCHNNTEQLMELSVANETINLPVIDNNYSILTSNASISKIQGYTYEGRTIELSSESAFTVKKGGNIDVNTDITVDNNKSICLKYVSGLWTIDSKEEIVLQPNDYECFEGDSAEFAVEVQGKTLSYQWFKSIDNGTSWSKTYFEGSKNNRIIIPVQKYMNNYLFRCEMVFSDGETIVSDAGKIILKKKQITIIRNPEACSCKENDNAVFSVDAEGESLKYQWYKSIDGGLTWTKTFYTGSCTSEITIPVKSYMNHYLFRCILADNSGNVCESKSGEIIISAFEIIKQPDNVDCKVGGSAVFELEVGGSPKTYQWYKSIDGGTTWTKTFFEGSRTNKLTVNVAKYMNGYLFKCNVEDFNGNITESNSAKINIIEGLKVIRQPENCICNNGETAVFSTEAIGAGNINYSWERSKDNGKTWEIVPYGATRYKKTLEFPVYSFIRDYLIRCHITDDEESIYTKVVKLKEPVKITKQPENITSDYDTTIAFTIEAEGEGLTYQWYSCINAGEEWISIPDATSPCCEVYFTDESESNYYKCVVSDCAGNIVQSDEVKAIKDEHRTIRLTADNDYKYTDDKYEYIEIVNSTEIIEGAALVSSSDSTNASLKYSKSVDVADDDVLLIHFSARAAQSCAKIRIDINNSFSGNYPISTEWEEYCFPFSVDSEMLNLTILLLTEYQDIEIRNLEILSYGKVDPSTIKSGIFMQDAAITRYYLDDSVGNGAISLKTLDEYLFAINNGRLTIYNAQNGTKPDLVSVLDGLGRVRDMKVLSGGDLLVVSSRENGVYFVDISDKKNPSIISNYSTLEMATGIDAVDNYLFICDRYHGVEILDITDVSSPLFCSEIKNDDELYDCKFSNGYLYIAAWGQKKVYVYSLSNIYNPILSCVISTDGWTAGLEIKNNILYVATGGKSSDKALSPLDAGFGMGNGLEIYDISTPDNPKWLSTSKVDGKYQDAGYDHWKVAVNGNVAILCGTYNGVYIFDVSDPMSPKRLNHLVVSLPYGTTGYYFNSAKTNVAYPYDPSVEIWSPILGVAIADGKLFFSSVDYGIYTYTDNCFVAEHDNDETFDFDRTSVDLPLVISNLNEDLYNITNVKDSSYSVYAIQANESYLYAACGNKGIIVYDKQTMEVLHHYDDAGNVLDIKISADYLYAAASSGGMRVYRICEDKLLNTGECNVSGSNISFSQVVYLSKPDMVVAQVAWGQYALIDVSDKEHPIVNRTVTTGNMYYRNISSISSDDAEYVLISSNSRFDLYKVNDSEMKIIYSSKKAFLGEIDGFAVDGNRIFYINKNGFGYYDMENDEEPDLSNASINTFSKVKLSGKAVIKNDLLIVNNPVTGIVSIIDIKDVDEPVLLNSIKFNANPDMCYIDGDRIYIPARHGGIIVLDKK